MDRAITTLQASTRIVRHPWAQWSKNWKSKWSSAFFSRKLIKVNLKCLRTIPVVLPWNHSEQAKAISHALQTKVVGNRRGMKDLCRMSQETQQSKSICSNTRTYKARSKASWDSLLSLPSPTLNQRVTKSVIFYSRTSSRKVRKQTNCKLWRQDPTSARARLDAGSLHNQKKKVIRDP